MRYVWTTWNNVDRRCSAFSGEGEPVFNRRGTVKIDVPDIELYVIHRSKYFPITKKKLADIKREVKFWRKQLRFVQKFGVCAEHSLGEWMVLPHENRERVVKTVEARVKMLETERRLKIISDYHAWVDRGYLEYPFISFTALSEKEQLALLNRALNSYRKTESRRAEAIKELKKQRKLNPDNLYTLVMVWTKPHTRMLDSGKLSAVIGHYKMRVMRVDTIEEVNTDLEKMED